MAKSSSSTLMMVVAVAGLQYISAAQGTGPCFTDPKSVDCANPSTFYPDDDVNMVSATHDMSFMYVSCIHCSVKDVCRTIVCMFVCTRERMQVSGCFCVRGAACALHDLHVIQVNSLSPSVQTPKQARTHTGSGRAVQHDDLHAWLRVSSRTNRI